MEEMMKAITRAAIAVAVYYETQVDGAEPRQPELPLAKTAAPAPVKERKPRAKKETPAPAAEAAAPTPEPSAPTGEIPEGESFKVLQDTARAYVQRFNKPIPGAVPPASEGFVAVKKMLAQDYKVAKMADLVHAQRVQLIAKLRAEIASADAAAKEPAVL